MYEKKTICAQTRAVTDVFDKTSKTQFTSTTNLDLLHGLLNSTSVLVKRGDKYHTGICSLRPHLLMSRSFGGTSRRRRTLTCSCACPSKRGSVTLPADGRSWRETSHTFVHVSSRCRFFHCVCARAVTHNVLSARMSVSIVRHQH